MCQKLGRLPSSFIRPLDVTFYNATLIGCKKGYYYAIRTGTGWPAGSKITIFNPKVTTSTNALYGYDGTYPTSARPNVTGPAGGVIMGRGADGMCGPLHTRSCVGWYLWAQEFNCNSAESIYGLCGNGCNGSPGDAIWIDAGLTMVTIQNEGVIAGGGAAGPYFNVYRDGGSGGSADGRAGGGGLPGGRGTLLSYPYNRVCQNTQPTDWYGSWGGATGYQPGYNSPINPAGGAGNSSAAATSPWWSAGNAGNPASYALKTFGHPYTWETGSSPLGNPYYPPVGGGVGRNDPFSPSVLRNGLIGP